MSISAQVTTTVDMTAIDTLIARYALIPAIIAKYADLIAAAARRYVPVLTGALRASITEHLEMWAAEITAGEGLAYAAAVEFGTAIRPAKPYLRPATEQYAAAFVAEVQALFV